MEAGKQPARNHNFLHYNFGLASRDRSVLPPFKVKIGPIVTDLIAVTLIVKLSLKPRKKTTQLMLRLPVVLRLTPGVWHSRMVMQSLVGVERY